MTGVFTGVVLVGEACLGEVLGSWGSRAGGCCGVLRDSEAV